jgi:cell division protein FtsA
MYGTRLEVEAHIVTGVATQLANVAKAVQSAGLEIDEMVLEPLASAEAVLSPSEREIGVVVADIGGGTTSLAVFANGGLCHAAILPVAGAHLTNDIAVGMRTPMAEAEKLKIRWGAATPSVVSEGEMIEVFNVSGRQPRVLPRRVLAEFIEPRVDEILSLVREQIRRSGYLHRIPAGIVLTGGSAVLEGLVEYAEGRLGLPARLGTSERLAGLVEAARSPAYSTGVGLALYGARARGRVGGSRRNGTSSWWDRTKAWVRDLLQGA